KRHYYIGRHNEVNTARSYTRQVNVVRGGPQQDDKGFVDSGCTRHMTGNITYLSDFKEFDKGYVAFGGVQYFSVSQMYEKDIYVLFTDTECIVLSPNFKLLDENQILLKIPRKDNMYSFDMKRVNTFVAISSEIQESNEKNEEGSEEKAKASRKKMLGRKRAKKEQQ
ncbi:hypothetical protein Tco_1572669, partial [Tanacetum coccineum]